MSKGGSKPCVNDCGRTVSANKLACLKCAKLIMRQNLEKQGISVTEEEITREVRFATGKG